MPMTQPWWSPESLARRRPFLKARRAATKAVRAYFQAEGFLDVETPILQVSGGIERHIRPLTTTLSEPFGQGSAARALHTSPEFAMKKLLVAGLPKIYQIARVFRDGERSPLHSPEFTMIEWYRAGADYRAMMTDCATLLAGVAKAAHRALAHDGLLTWQGRTCDPALEPERLTVAEAFARHAGIDLLATIDDAQVAMPNPDRLRDALRKAGLHASVSDTWEDLFFRVMLDRIEPKLGEGRATILCEYPACLAALARRNPSDPRVAERFELYACGVELANAFSELTDAAEQRRRFAHDRVLHQQLYGTAPALDEDFLAALDAGLPESAGCALGFDRLVMLAAHAGDITDVLWAPVA
ncbi:MAG: EF-P lysine aminoacylase EpmA [Rhodospirillaceae bacterium]|nr:EF-P lysine aminoacylase EpmA [Rhodospirillaceae bacterium]